MSTMNNTLFEARRHFGDIHREWVHLLDEHGNHIEGDSVEEVIQSVIDNSDAESADELIIELSRIYVAKISVKVAADLSDFSKHFVECKNCGAVHRHGSTFCECGADVGGP